MVSSLSKIIPWSRARRWHKLAYDPASAPHRKLVAALVRKHLPPLTVRLRADAVDDLVLRILGLETSPIPLVEDPEPRQLLLLISRMQQAVGQVETEQAALKKSFSRFSDTYARTDDPDEQRSLVADYLQNTHSDPRKLAKDLKALQRYMGYDVLRERNATELADMSIKVETGIEFIGMAGRACLLGDDQASRPTPAELFAQTHADRFLGVRLERADRWQARLATAISIFQTYGEPLAGADAETRATVLDPTVIAAIERTARNRDDSPWVQAKALESLLALAPDLAREVLQTRLFGDGLSAVRTDFLFRRQAVTMAARYLNNLGAASLFTRMVDRPDPSEHVRMGVCEAIALLPPPAAVAALVRFMGAAGMARESSARVRAAAVIALSQVLITSTVGRSDWEIAGEALLDLFASDSDLLVLQMACEELPLIGEALRRVDAAAFIDCWGPRWITAVENMSASARTPPQASDVAAHIAEKLERLRSADRTALVAYLHREVDGIRPGKRRVLRWRKMPRDIAAALKQPMALGRTMAELATGDWGLSAHLGRRGLVLWRGDIYRRRLWRILHEMRNPAPNKRQGYTHTWGRTPRGELRAPPSGLDEVTPTTVPGERTHVDEAGGWGRYLPLVDDILDLPVLSARPVRIFSSHGVTTITPARSLWRRLWNRLRVSWTYRVFAIARQAALAATEAGERHKYVRAIADKLGATVTFTPYERGLPDDQPSPTSMRVLSLFRGKAALGGNEAAAVAVLPPLEYMRDWLSTNGPYFLSLHKNSQTALAVFLATMFGWFVLKAYVRRLRLALARKSIPLSLGGWGTRGKSGTERLKAGMLHGMGYHVMAKTTGCEAMFINAAPGQQAVEIFIYRPYDKATIWEQADVLTWASRVHADVFLWECMALNPRYVELLQHEWMRDDIVTLTNAYPDHEDIQGPAGYDVAQVISRFIPHQSVVITSETNFLPLFTEVARSRGTAFHAVLARHGDLIAKDMLDLFPYSEHPRNIALVARMAEELGFERHMAMALMAENVVPDLGVLKAYGPVCVRGRNLTFVNGCSANERTGFLNNWRRVGLDKLDIDADPRSMVVTVVNNRADRIARSKVFADILVNDTAVDRHVLIGTNLKGLHSYLNTALDEYLEGKVMVQTVDFDEDDPSAVTMRRLVREMKRLRIMTPSSKGLIARLELYGAGAGLCLAAESAVAELSSSLDKLLREGLDGEIVIDDVHKRLSEDQGLAKLIERALVEQPAGTPPLEAFEPATLAHVVTHFIETVARVVVRARLEARLRKVMDTRAGIETFHTDFGRAYRALFASLIVTVHDPGTPGDKIIDMCASSVPPGVNLVLLGTQNIKGTGLDFVYRWIAIDKILTVLGQLDTERQDVRTAALSELEGMADYGLFGAGHTRASLSESRFRAMYTGEESLRERVLAKVNGIVKTRRVLLEGTVGKSQDSKVLKWVESWLDYLDSIRRRRMSSQIMEDVIARRISLGRAAIEMRTVLARQKGGWLKKMLSKKSPAA